jgi:transposase
MAQKFRDRLLNEIQLKNLTLRDVARIFGVSLDTADRWISGINEPHEAMQGPMFMLLDTYGKDQNGI